MRITASELTLNSERLFIAGREVRETLDMQRGDNRVQLDRHARTEVVSASRTQLSLTADVRALSPRQLDAARAQIASAPPGAAPQASQPAGFDLTPDDEELHKLRMLLVVLGRQVEEIDKTLAELMGVPAVPGPGSLPAAASPDSIPATPGRADTGRAETGLTETGRTDFLNYSYNLTEWRGASLTVSASGQFSTADGRQIQYGMQLEMRNVQYSSQSLSIRAGAALQDPLVLNLAAGPVSLDGGRRVDFDLDADGKVDSMAAFASHSAFLALDRNGNGRVDDGRELFGALTGDGFAELAAFDQDGNGFIDEGDAVFQQLRLWQPDSQGGGALVGLQAAGVGAIGLARAHADFDLTSGQQLEGRVRSTGLFVFESGQVGSLQQIDLAV